MTKTKREQTKQSRQIKAIFFKSTCSSVKFENLFIRNRNNIEKNICIFFSWCAAQPSRKVQCIGYWFDCYGCLEEYKLNILRSYEVIITFWIWMMWLKWGLTVEIIRGRETYRKIDKIRKTLEKFKKVLREIKIF